MRKQGSICGTVLVLKGQANPGDDGAVVDGVGEEDILPSLTASSSPARVFCSGTNTKQLMW